jgi:uncharacterized protein
VSQENVEVVRRFEEVMVDGGIGNPEERIEQALSLLDENVAFRPFPAMPGHGGDWIGHDGFLRMCEAYGSAWEPPEGVEFEYLDCGGETVVTLISFTSRSRISGREVPVRMIEVVTVRDGKIVELVPYYADTVPFVEAARA